MPEGIGREGQEVPPPVSTRTMASACASVRRTFALNSRRALSRTTTPTVGFKSPSMLLLSMITLRSPWSFSRSVPTAWARLADRARSQSARLAPANRNRPVSVVIEAFLSSLRMKPRGGAARRVDRSSPWARRVRCRLILTAVQPLERSPRISPVTTDVLPTLCAWPPTTTIFIPLSRPCDATSIETAREQVNALYGGPEVRCRMALRASARSARMAGEGEAH